MPSADLSRLVRDAAEVIRAEELEARLERGKPLRVKLGLDPTAAQVTLGWAVVLRKLRRFQVAGHTAVLIVGDFTARVGDPSGKSETRRRLPKETVREYADQLLEQFWKILDRDATEVRYNSEWLESMDMEAVLRMTASFTVAQMLERDDFAKRYAERKPISVMEFMYPLLQGMDSVAVEADVELGGTDQLFNLMVGRDLQRERGQEPQVVLCMPLLEGLDGVQKMSQSLGNYVGITEPPEEMFGKLMSIPDELIDKYIDLCTDLREGGDLSPEERRLVEGEGRPDLRKRLLARAVVALYHGPSEALEAEARFDRVYREHQIPEEVPEAQIPAEAVRDGAVWLPRLLVSLDLAPSNAEARRLVEQGGVRLDGRALTDPSAELDPAALEGRVLSVGRRKFVRLQPQQATS